MGAFSFDEIVSNKVANAADPSKPALVHDSFKLVPGKSGRAALLDGENGFTLPGIGHFTRSDPFTIGLWLQTPSHASRQVVLHHSRAWMDAGSRGYELLLEDGKVSVGLHHMWPGNSIKVRTQRTVPTNHWAHVAFTYDGSSRADGLKVYLDGQPTGVEIIRDALWKDFTYDGGEPDLAIGNRFRDSGFKDGRVDDLRIFNRAVTPLEIAHLVGRENLTSFPAGEGVVQAFERPFPPHPGPLPQGEGPTSAAQGLTQRPVVTPERTTALPLPTGEGQGEGEQATHDPTVSHTREVLHIDSAKLTLTQREYLLGYFLANVHAPARRWADDLHKLRSEQRQLIEPIPEAMVMEEMPKPKPAHILKRGAYDAPGDQVSANTPAALPPLPPDAPHNRLGLARWLVAPGHPLTARVTVNRAWQQMFGRGIVETSDNFGSQGAPPTHPELLDWLALEFADTGWDMKRLLKLVALSATYRQSSKTTPEMLARDPANQLLARGPARRLTAEMLRDQALSVSGLLAAEMGGPSVKPYQPAGLWEIAMGNPRYDQGKGDDLHRRSLYTFWKRTVPPPAMVTFDAAERNVCTVRRQSTSTPLQALALLNDTQMAEAARFIGQRMFKEGGATTAQKVAWAFRLVTGRRATEKESALLEKLFAEEHDLFTAEPEAAQKLLGVGEAKNDPALAPADLAAGTVLAQALLNHDETVMRR